MLSSAFIGYVVGLNVFFKYTLIAVLAPFGGPLFIMGAGLLIHQHLIALVPTLIAICIGELSMDALWYMIGYRYAHTFIEKYGKFFSITPDSFGRAKALFTKRGPIILSISKVTMGLGMMQLILITAASTRIRFSIYLLACSAGEVLWVSLLLYLGYFYANLYSVVQSDIRIVVIVGSAILITLLFLGFSKFLRKRALGQS